MSAPSVAARGSDHRGDDERHGAGSTPRGGIFAGTADNRKAEGNHEGSALRRGLRGPLSRWLLALATRCDRPTAPGADPVTADQPHVTAGEDYTLIGRGPTPTQPVGGVAVTGGVAAAERQRTHQQPPPIEVRSPE